MAFYDLLPTFDYIEPNNLKGLQPGEHEIPVEVKGSDLRVKYSSKTTKVTLRITEKK